VDEQEKAAFLGLSGHIMKRLLQHHARPLYRQWEKVSLSEGLCKDTARSETLQEVEDALTQLAAINPKLRAIVEMRVFEGLNGGDIAARLGCSRRSAAVYWSVAKRWLQSEWAGRLDEEAKTIARASSNPAPPLGNQ
jgi:DNA-directed RNA polymerase specialized sigma24 family protein